jgi:nickel/cobalt transporter (NicO) family protein
MKKYTFFLILIFLFITLPLFAKELSENPRPTLYRQFILLQHKGMILVNNNIRALKTDFKPITYLTLILFALGYGAFHALGPGHGKALVTSYFLHKSARLSDALKLAIIIAFVHSGAALLLAALYMTLLSSVRGLARIQMQSYFNFGSGVLIVLLSFFLLSQKFFSHIKKNTARPNLPDFLPCQGEVLEGRRGWKMSQSDRGAKGLWLVGISSGLVPCPIALTIMLITIPVGLFYIGLSAVLALSISQSLVLFILGVITIKSQHKLSTEGSSQLSKLKNILSLILSYAGLVFIFLIGLFIMFRNWPG